MELSPCSTTVNHFLPGTRRCFHKTNWLYNSNNSIDAGGPLSNNNIVAVRNQHCGMVKHPIFTSLSHTVTVVVVLVSSLGVELLFQ